MTSRLRSWISRPGVLAVGGSAIAGLAIALPATGLAFTDRWDVPLVYDGDGLAVASHVKSIIETGWYEHQPRLGAPHGQDYHDYPTQDDANFLALRMIAAIVPVWGVVMNVHFLIGFALAAATMAWFLLRVGIRPIPTCALALVYALAPYHFYRGEAHMFLSWYWVVPLGLVIVWRILRSEPLWGARAGIPRGLGHLLGRTGGTAVSLVLLATVSVYYGVFIAVLAVCAAIGVLVIVRDRQRFLGSVLAGAILVVVLVLVALPDWVHGWTNGQNAAALVRSPPGAEIYALKLTALLLPAPAHRFGPFAELRALYDQYYPVSSEAPALGLIGAAGLVALVVVLALTLVRAVLGRTAPAGAWRVLGSLGFLVFIALLFSWLGGVATIISFVSSSIRAWNRMSIVIAALALAAIGVLIDLLVKRVVSGGRPRWIGPVTASVAGVVLVGIAYWDQVPAYDADARTATIAEFDSDAAFAQAIESSSLPGAMVFQLPYLAFPESPPVGRASDSDQLRMFLHTDTLRFSGGGIKGRAQIDRFAQLAESPAPELVSGIEELGFVGVIVDRFADVDGTLESGLVEELDAPALQSADRRFAYWSIP